MTKNFVHLHVHSHYSLLDGLSKIDEILAKTKEYEMPAVALTDHGNLYGAIEFYKKAKDAGIKPILGVEAYLTQGNMRSKGTAEDKKRHHLILLAKNNTGWKNLLQLVSAANLEGFYYKPRIDKELLEKHKEGLICLSACMSGEISRLLQNKNYKEAERSAAWYKSIFGEDFYLEIQPHSPELHKPILDISKKLNIPVVATQDSHYINKDDQMAHEILLAIQTRNPISDDDRLSLKEFDLSFKSPGEMEKIFKDIPEAITNTLHVAEKCNVEIRLKENRIPKFPLPEGESPQSYLEKLVSERLPNRYPKVTPEVKERARHELDVIDKTGFADYFLIVQDFVNWAKDHGIAVGPGRGSAAGSLVSYVLGITNIDPLKYNLLFERFLNPSRNEMPDIDIDFADTRRDEVIAYVRERFGEDKVAQIITFGTMMARAAVRDTGRALGFPYSFCDKIAKLIPFNSTLKEAMETVPDLKKEYSMNRDAKKLLDSAIRLEGTVRHASVHAAGVVISPEPLVNLVPLQRAPQGVDTLITQFEMHSIEDLGLLKMDFLGLRNLTIIENTLRLIKDRHNVEIDMENLPLDDKRVFKMLASADTTGVFQLESSGMRRYLKEIQPTELEDIIAMISLYRPGPMDLIPTYLKRKFGEEEITYLHPKLEPILSPTYGVGIYQEQMMRIARDLGGFTLAEADTLRKAIGKKIKSLLDKQKEKLIKGMIENGIDKSTAEKIWNLFPPFARYGFNRCVTGDTLVYNPKTGDLVPIKTIHETSKKSEAVSLNSNLKLEKSPIAQSYYNGKKKVWNIRTRSGREITATANHPFLTPSGWQILNNLKVGMKVAVPRQLPEPEKTINTPHYKLALLGYLLAEGNLCHPHGFYFYSKEESEINDYLNYLESFKNTVGRVNKSKSAIAVYAKRQNLKLKSEAVNWIESLGLKYKKAKEKFFPDFIFNLPNHKLAVLIGKMFQGDGCINVKRGPQIFYATSSKEIARGLQHLLLRFGILSTIHQKRFKYRGMIKPGYTVTVSRYNNIKKFIEAFGKYFVGEKAEAVKSILANHPILNGKIKTWSARGSFDTIPVELVINKIRKTVMAGGTSLKDFERQHGLSWRLFMYDKRKVGYLRETVGIIADITGSQKLYKYAESDIYWDKVVSIEKAGIKDTYDLTIGHHHNFVANDIIVHNSHATSYAMISYQTAYLKAHYPVEFMTSLLNTSGGDTDRINFLVGEARRVGIEVLPPDVNLSFKNFTIDEENGNIRFGLLAIKNIGLGIVENLIEERRRGGPFANLQDFLSRIKHRDLNKKSLESLIKCGAFDSLGITRAEALGSLDELLKFNQAVKYENQSNQTNLFGGTSTLLTLKLNSAQNIEKGQLLAWEKELLGLYLTDHPFKYYAQKLKGKVRPIKEIIDQGENEDYPGYLNVAGVITGIKKLVTKRGDPMLFVTLEDETSKIEVLVFANTLEKTKSIWLPNKAVIINGRLSWRDNDPKIICEKAKEI